MREQISYGADWIKIYADRGYYRLPDGSYRSRPNFTAEEITAIGDETLSSGKKLAAHAVTRDGIIAAINARAAVKSAFLNVRINLSGIKDMNKVIAEVIKNNMLDKKMAAQIAKELLT